MGNERERSAEGLYHLRNIGRLGRVLGSVFGELPLENLRRKSGCGGAGEEL
jgi:hypothetical protein